MNISKKQLEEIDFLEKYFDAGETTQEQREEYINWSVKGIVKKSLTEGMRDTDTNPLVEAKRMLDIMVKMWRQDLSDGLFWVEEFTNKEYGGYNHPFATKLFNGIIKGINFHNARPGQGTPEFVLLNSMKKMELQGPLIKGHE